MYPFIRMFKELAIASRQSKLNVFDEHISHHICWPWDLDLWNELNNGRTLTLYDLGRIPLAQRTGLAATLRQEKWGMAIAGAAVRYRRRVKMFDRITTRSQLLGWDDKFIYLEQSMWKTNGECASHCVFRSAVTDRNGIVPPIKLARALTLPEASPGLPDWVQKWLDAEDLRPWPPMQKT